MADEDAADSPGLPLPRWRRRSSAIPASRDARAMMIGHSTWARRQFRHDAAKCRMFVQLAAYDIGTDDTAALFVSDDDGGGGFVAAGLDTENDG